jgi:hypothetical protein
VLAADEHDREEMGVVRQQLAETRSSISRRLMVRGEVFRLPPPKSARGHEQRGAYYAVVVQADEVLGLSMLFVSPRLVRRQRRTKAVPSGPNVSAGSTRPARLE